MARPRNVDPQARTAAMLDAIIEVFKRRGYDGAALSDLAAATGLAKASFYHRFPGGKPEIGRAALAESGRRFTQHILRPLQSTAPAAERLAAMFDGVLRYYGHGQPACLMNTMTLGEGAALFGKDIRLTITAWERLLAQALEALGTDPQAAAAQAQEIIARIQGALVVARLSGREAELPQQVGRLRGDLVA